MFLSRFFTTTLHAVKRQKRFGNWLSDATMPKKSLPSNAAFHCEPVCTESKQSQRKTRTSYIKKSAPRLPLNSGGRIAPLKARPSLPQRSNCCQSSTSFPETEMYSLGATAKMCAKGYDVVQRATDPWYHGPYKIHKIVQNNKYHRFN